MDVLIIPCADFTPLIVFNYFDINQSINQSIHFIADKLHPYKSSKKPLSRTGVHTINFSNAATRET